VLLVAQLFYFLQAISMTQADFRADYFRRTVPGSHEVKRRASLPVLCIEARAARDQ